MAEGDADLDRHIARVVDSLAERFNSTNDKQAVEQAVVDARAKLESVARVTNYLPRPDHQTGDRPPHWPRFRIAYRSDMTGPRRSACPVQVVASLGLLAHGLPVGVCRVAVDLEASSGVSAPLPSGTDEEQPTA